MRARSGLGLVVVVVALVAVAPAAAAPTVWVVDDGERVRRDDTALAAKTGAGNPVWQPGQPVRLFALRNETVALQVVVEADAAGAAAVTVDLDALTGPGAAVIANDPGATDPARFVGRRLERFVAHWFDVLRPSGASYDATVSLGWAGGSGPDPARNTGWVADALIPVEVAPAWAPYPLEVAAGQNGVVWLDVTVPRGQPAGLYTGTITVRAGGQEIASLPVELTVVRATLPDRPVRTMLYYARGELDRRIGAGDAAERQLWQLLRRHRLTAMHGAMTVADAQAQLPALDGSAFTAAAGYEGPGEGVGDDVLSLGTYGGYGAPDAGDLANVEAVAAFLDAQGLLASVDVFVYAIDEDCSSSYGADWKSLLATSTSAAAASVKVGWTCSEDPTTQPVDLVMMGASAFDPQQAAATRAAGREVWVYNGSRPQVGSFMTDDDIVALRANGWIAAVYDVGRWFYWETTFWYDDNNGGLGAYDPFVTAETFHNNWGEWCEGDGVLLYPGRQIDQFTDHTVGFDGVLPSVRLKSFRRGIEDAGYYQLAHAASPAAAEAVAAGQLPRVLSAAQSGQPPSWPAEGQPWFDARQALLALVPLDPAEPAGDGGVPGPDDGGTAPPAPDGGQPVAGGASAWASGCAVALPAGGGGVALLGLLALLGRRRGRPYFPSRSSKCR
jgi:hypothetical protein